MFKFIRQNHSRLFNSVTKDYVENAVKNNKPVIIDVREPDEIKEGKIGKAREIPLGNIKAPGFALDGDIAKTDEIIVYCRSGKRSEMAAIELEKKGYSNVSNYAGSWLDWRLDLSVKLGSGREPSLRRAGASLPAVSTVCQNKFKYTIMPIHIVAKDYVQEAVKNGKPVIIDVREPDEVKESGKIGDAKEIPLSIIKTPDFALDGDIAKTDEIIVYCKSGRRAGFAAIELENKGYSNIANYAGSWMDWSK